MNNLWYPENGQVCMVMFDLALKMKKEKDNLTKDEWNIH